ncbi:VanZ family protein [Peribacillus sp. NPDC097295]|uniref:VanZ family protein n=1 Tax=Peribacillus sp. NPDC097295 TaxID=3364402 RepID=UPI0038177471
MDIKLRKRILVGTIIYTILIFYFLYLAFGRLEHFSLSSRNGYTFIFVPEGVPLSFPRLDFGWIYSFGNIATFIPYGILIPLLYRVSFRKFISLFVLSILFLETIQALTHLGSFDLDDVFVNTLGATIGFIAYKVGFSSKLSLKKLIVSVLSIVVLLVGVIVISETVDYVVAKREGPIQALHDVKELNGIIPMIGNLSSFTVAGKKIEPKLNVYTSKDGKSKSYTYNLENKEDVTLYAYFGISDNGDSKGELTIEVDGNRIIQRDETWNKEAEKIIVPLFHMMNPKTNMTYSNVNEISITVSGNANLWDVRFSEQKHWWE